METKTVTLDGYVTGNQGYQTGHDTYNHQQQSRVHSDISYGFPPKLKCDGLWLRPLNQSGVSTPPRCNCTKSSISCINLQMRPAPSLFPSMLAQPQNRQSNHGNQHQQQQKQQKGGTPQPQHHPDYFMDINATLLPNIAEITIHGNNLEQLPTHLFNPASGYQPTNRLKFLNLSANYFIHTDKESLAGLTSLEVLDLSDNEIVFTDEQTDLFVPVPNLKKLYLAKAFNYGQNKSEQLDNLMLSFSAANLRKLEVLSLDDNYFPRIPPQLGCTLPSLKRLHLARNPLHVPGNGDRHRTHGHSHRSDHYKTSSYTKTAASTDTDGPDKTKKPVTINTGWEAINTRCFSQLELLDLSSLRTPTLGADFVKFADALPANTKIKLRQSKLDCTCNLAPFIRWLNTTDRVVDRDDVICFRAAPNSYFGQKVAELDPTKLACSFSGAQSTITLGAGERRGLLYVLGPAIGTLLISIMVLNKS